MIEATLSPLELIAGRETDLTIRLINRGPGMCSNVVFKLVLPNEIMVLQGSARLEVPRLPSGEAFSQAVRVRPQRPGTWVTHSTNFSYRDRHGFARRIDDFQAELVVERRPAVTVSQPRLQVRVITDSLTHGEWGTLRGRVENIGESGLFGVDATLDGPLSVDDKAKRRFLGSVAPGTHADFAFPVRAKQCGNVPIHLDIAFTDDVGRQQHETITATVAVGLTKSPIQPDKVRILFLAANPVDTTRLAWEKDFHRIEDVLRKSPQASMFELRNRFAVQDTDINDALLTFRPHVVHFSGHGLEDGRIYVENEFGRARPVPIDGLARLFGLSSSVVKCVIVSACHSLELAKCIAREIDYVIGMSDRILDASAIRFSIGFYQALAAKESIEDAFRSGCVLIQTQSHHGEQCDVPQLIRRN